MLCMAFPLAILFTRDIWFMQKDQYENSVVELLQVATETYIKKD